MVLAVWIAANWLFALTVPLTTTSTVTVPYSYFLHQVQAGNVVSVDGQGSAIQGTLRHKITYPAGSNGTTTTEFSTERPTFANDNLFSELLA